MKTLSFSFTKYLLAIFLFATALLLVGLLLTKNSAKADVTQNNSAGTWSGNLGGSQNDIYKNTNITISSALSGGYQAQLSSGTTNGSLISNQITPDPSKFKKWKQVSVSYAYPSGVPIGNSSITFDILCGDQANNCGSTSFDSPFPGFAGLAPANGVIDISTLTATSIEIRANWLRKTNAASSTLFSWSANWEVKGGVSFVITKSRSVANPKPYNCTPCPAGMGSDYTVDYTINYSFDESVTGAQITLPKPAATFEGRNYGPLTLVSSTAGTDTGTTVVFNLGNKSAGTVGSVSATFTVPTGPPDQTVFSTTAVFSGKDSSGNQITLNTPTDYLVISSQSYLQPRIVGPEYVSPGTKVTYILVAAAGGLSYQGDVFNAEHTFTYPSACFTYNSYSAPGGVTANGSTPGQVVFNTGNFYFYPPQNVYTVTLTAQATCGVLPAPFTVTWSITSDQDASFYAPLKSISKTSTFDTPNTPRIRVDKYSNTPVGPGQRIGYRFRFVQDSTYAISNYTAVDAVPVGTTFLYANFGPGVLTMSGINPNASNKFSIWTSSNNSNYPYPPALNDPSWENISSGGLPCSAPAFCVPANPSSVKWVKWQVSNFYWDKYANNDNQYANMEVLVNPSTTSGTITNTMGFVGSNACSSWCNSGSTSVSVTQSPYMQFGYGPNPNSVDAGNTAHYDATLLNAWDNFGFATSDAKAVHVAMKLPDPAYIDTTTVNAVASCQNNINILTNCPDESGNIIANPTWLTGTYHSVTTDPDYGNVTWDIPLIYSALDYPQVMPFYYLFSINVKTKTGFPTGQIAYCKDKNGNIVTCTMSVSANNKPKNLTPLYTRSENISSNLTIISSPTLLVCPTLGSPLQNCPEQQTDTVQALTQKSIPFQGSGY